MPRILGNNTTTAGVPRNLQFKAVDLAGLQAEEVDSRDIGSLGILDDGSVYKLVAVDEPLVPTTGTWVLDFQVAPPAAQTAAADIVVAEDGQLTVVNPDDTGAQNAPLPAAPVDGQRVRILDISANGDGAVITLTTAAVGGIAGPAVTVVDTNQAISAIYSEATDAWISFYGV